MILILLTILKIIGIILLVLLGLIVLLLCLVLFAPVKYQAKGTKHPDELSVSAFVSYLWPLVRVRVEYPSETVLSVKILWINLLHPKEKKVKSTKKVKNVNRGRVDQNAARGYAADHKKETETVEKYSAVYQKEAEIRKEYSADYQKKAETVKEDAAGQNRENGSKSARRDKKKTSGKTSGKASKKAKNNSRNEKDTQNRIAAIAALLWQYKEMYPDVLGRVFHALKSVLPRKCNIHLIFGTGSPDNTGYLYGAYCALQEYLPGTIVFEPVWMESYLDVEFELSGNIRFIHFVTAAVKIIADKRVRKFISEIRRL